MAAVKGRTAKQTADAATQKKPSAHGTVKAATQKRAGDEAKPAELGKLASPASLPQKADKKQSGPRLRTKAGTTLTPEAEAELAAEAEAGYDVDKLVPRRVTGRPSLSSRGGSSRRISVRVDDETYDVLQQVAQRVGRSPSELVREVLQAAYAKR